MAYRGPIMAGHFIEFGLRIVDDERDVVALKKRWDHKGRGVVGDCEIIEQELAVTVQCDPKPLAITNRPDREPGVGDLFVDTPRQRKPPEELYRNYRNIAANEETMVSSDGPVVGAGLRAFLWVGSEPEGPGDEA